MVPLMAPFWAKDAGFLRCSSYIDLDEVQGFLLEPAITVLGIDMWVGNA
jgi:hypothetical protein